MTDNDYLSKISSGITPSSFEAVEALKNVELLVPLYQRLFVWEEEQISQFLSDLHQAFQKDKEAPYYIGALTIFNNSKNNGPTWEVVDGQQRITVLALLGACLGSQSKPKDPTWGPFLRRNDREPRLRYFARDDDQDDLGKIMTDGCTAKIKNANMKPFLEVFGRFPEMTTDAFSKFVYTKATALVSLLPDFYEVNDLNLYFEKMNAAGKQLEAHEILKVRYFAKHSVAWNTVADGSRVFRPGSPAASRDESGDKNPTLEHLLTDGNGLTEVEKEKRESDNGDVTFDSSRLVITFPVFLLHVLSICVGRDCADKTTGFWNWKSLLATFQSTYKTWASNGGSAEKFVAAMEAYRTWMDKWIINIEDGLPVSPFRCQTEVEKERETANSKPLWQFQSMLYVSGDALQLWVLEAYAENKKSLPDDPNEDHFLTMLKQHDNKRHQFYADAAAEWSYRQIERYWFWKLDYILWEKREELFNEQTQRDAVDSYTFRGNRSIEHLHPQNPPTDTYRWEDKVLNSFGNLAMISAGFNSQQGNHGVAEKFGRLKDQLSNGKQKLESIKLLLMFNEAERNENGWTVKASESHGSKMIEILKSYYDAIPEQQPSALAEPA